MPFTIRSPDLVAYARQLKELGPRKVQMLNKRSLNEPASSTQLALRQHIAALHTSDKPRSGRLAHLKDIINFRTYGRAKHAPNAQFIVFARLRARPVANQVPVATRLVLLQAGTVPRYTKKGKFTGRITPTDVLGAVERRFIPIVTIMYFAQFATALEEEFAFKGRGGA